MVWKRAAGLALAVVMGVGSTTAVRAADDIKVGAFLSVTGVMSLMGDPEKKTLEMMVEKINAEGGLLGRKVSLTIYDDGSEQEKAVSLVKRLIENDQVDVVIGGSGTPTSMAVIPVVEKAQIPYVSMGGGIGIVDPVRKWVFKVPQTDRMAAEKVLQDMQKRGVKKMALLSENVGFGKSGRDQTIALAPKYGIEVAADETYSPKDPDVTPQLTKIRGTAGVEALFIFGTGNGPAVVTKNIRQLGLTLPAYQSHGVASKDFLRLVGTAADGMRLPVGALTIPEQLPAADPSKQLVTWLKKAYEDRYKTDCPSLAGHGYDALMIALDGIKRAGTTDKAKVRDAIEATKGHVGAHGVFTMSATDHMGLGLDAFHMVEIRNGDWVPVN